MAEDKVMGRDMENLDKWRKQVQKRFEFYINKETDADILEWFEQIPNKRQYILELLRKDMNGHKKPTDEEN
jgi:flagellar biosynthesis chaperone FliJ